MYGMFVLMASVANEELVEPPTKDLYRNGDLMLVAGEDFVPAHRLRVSRDTVCMASPVWRAIHSWDGQFSEAPSKEVTFGNDDPKALPLILQMAPFQFSEVLQKMVLQKLVDIAILCNKYDTVAMVRPFIPGWV